MTTIPLPTAPQAEATPRSPAKTGAPRIAAIDIGTNSIRLAVAEVQPDGTYRILDEDREMTRLGHGLFETGRLAEEPMAHSLRVLGRMKAIVEGFGVGELRTIATSAVREATNGREFVREAWKRCRVRVDVVPPEEEARLALRSVRRHYDLGDRRTAIVDIGGGSTEVVLAVGGLVELVVSLPLGAVRLTERYLPSDPVKPKHWNALQRAIDAAIKEGMGKVPFAADVMIGSGGTFTNLVEMVQCEREGKAGNPRNYPLARAEVTRLLDRLRETPLAARREIPGLNPQRADIIVAGVAVVDRLAKRVAAQRVLVNDRGIRDGVLLAMIEDLPGMARPRRVAPPDRMDSARRLARQCRSNERHCERVALLAVQLFDALRRPFDLPPEGREVLMAGALLHDIGYLINHERHHKHAYHLIMHGDLPGFSAREVELIANVARYHRRAAPKKDHPNFGRLTKDERRLVRRLSGILRIADGLDRTHGGIVKAVRARAGRKAVRISVSASRNPSIELDDARRKSGLFEKAFDRALVFSPYRARARRRA
ncbi:MAG TPA: Ppx/GppA phosphatase family protein [Gemmatimonadales bacterium]|nr:Ppx/GppA phosphatase family protein [Gemmatimonadales bacterium]